MFALLQEFYAKLDSILSEDIELDGEEAHLMSKCNLTFYFTMCHPSQPNCVECLKGANKMCNCNKILYRSELLMNTVCFIGFDC